MEGSGQGREDVDIGGVTETGHNTGEAVALGRENRKDGKNLKIISAEIRFVVQEVDEGGVTTSLMTTNPINVFESGFRRPLSLIADEVLDAIQRQDK